MVSGLEAGRVTANYAEIGHEGVGWIDLSI